MNNKMVSSFSVFPRDIPSKLQLSTILRDFISNTKFLEELLKFQTEELSSSTPTIESLTFKAINHLLINRKNLPPLTANKKLVKCGFDLTQRRKVYSLPFAVTKEVKLSVFQFKVTYNILSTNSLLYK